MTRALLILIGVFSSGCMVLSDDTYFSPTTWVDYELASPCGGHPWNTFPFWSAPSDVITVKLEGVRLGECVRTKASSFYWVGQFFIPLIPIPDSDPLDTSRLEIWFAMLAESDVEIHFDSTRLHTPDDPVGVAPTGFLWHQKATAVNEPQGIEGGQHPAWYVEYRPTVADHLDAFDLRIEGIVVDGVPLSPVHVGFSLAKGWRVTSLP
jgi:hypothetical protein